ncbi:hypothetical protein [Streptomyces aureus]|uniref:hypothetical protein n=1 Tax=Streptomyces aureus TaxID=193461 RepID=UPI0006E1FE94|nr:hypothetical protein [Streptomyces aureus]
MLQVPVQQQDLHQGFGALDVAEGGLRRGPERFVGAGEGVIGPGLVESFRAGEGARLAQEDFEVVVEDDAVLTPTGQPGMAGDLRAAVVAISSVDRRTTRTWAR